MNFRHLLGCDTIIRNSTRVTNCSNTLLDRFATNAPKFITISGVKTIRFSDHDLIYGMHKVSSKVKKARVDRLRGDTCSYVCPQTWLN